MPTNTDLQAEHEAQHAVDPLIDKLGRYVPLTSDERDALRQLARKPQSS